MDLNLINNKITSFKKEINSAIYGRWAIVEKLKNNQEINICEFDTFLSYNFKSDNTLPTYQIQSGSFRNYNKINGPYIVNISLATSGNRNKIAKLIIDVEKYNQSTKLIDIITPYKTFIDYNMGNLNYAVKEAEAVSTLIIKFDAIEILGGSVNFGKVKNTNYSKNQNSGKTQPQEVPKEKYTSLLVKGSDKLNSFFGGR